MVEEVSSIVGSLIKRFNRFYVIVGEVTRDMMVGKGVE